GRGHSLLVLAQEQHVDAAAGGNSVRPGAGRAVAGRIRAGRTQTKQGETRPVGAELLGAPVPKVPEGRGGDDENEKQQEEGRSHGGLALPGLDFRVHLETLPSVGHKSSPPVLAEMCAKHEFPSPGALSCTKNAPASP